MSSEEKAVHGVSLRDPVDGSFVTVIGEDAEWEADRLNEISHSHRLTILEVYRMVRVWLFGPVALDDDFDPFAELERRQRDLERDSALLCFDLPIEEKLVILERMRDHVRWMAERHYDPARRTECAALLEVEATMKRLLSKRQP